MRLLALALLAATVAAAGCSGSSEPVRTDHVSIPGPWRFDPQVAQVTHGATVTWTNHGGQTHSVTFDDGFDQDVAPGASITRTFPAAGTFTYHCKYHPPDMKGSVIVD